MTIHLCWNELVDVSRIFRNISLKNTSICILMYVLNLDNRARKMDKESSKTVGTEDTPFLDSATHKYCLIALMNISFVLKTGPAFCNMANSSWRDNIFDLSSCDLQQGKKSCQKTELQVKEKKEIYFGSGFPSGRGFMLNRHKDRKTRNASFCNMWENLAIETGTSLVFPLRLSDAVSRLSWLGILYILPPLGVAGWLLSSEVSFERLLQPMLPLSFLSASSLPEYNKWLLKLKILELEIQKWSKGSINIKKTNQGKGWS